MARIDLAVRSDCVSVFALGIETGERLVKRSHPFPDFVCGPIQFGFACGFPLRFDRCPFLGIPGVIGAAGNPANPSCQIRCGVGEGFFSLG